jgi:nucleoporin GLE1
LTRSQILWHDERDKARAADLERLSTLHAQQTAEVQGYLNSLRQQQQKEELKLKERWKARDQLLWQRIESVIKMEEDKDTKL